MSQNQYLTMFIEEGHEHLSLINEQLPRLSEEENQTTTLNDVFRSAHTIKGMAASMNFTVMADVTHQFENMLDDLRTGNVSLENEHMNLFFMIVDFLDSSLESIEESGTELPYGQELEQQLLRMNPNEVRSSMQDDIDGYTLRMLAQALEEGIPLKTVHVEVDEQAMLKGVRAYMVINELSNLGEILHTNPNTEALEEGLFDRDFQVIVATGSKAQDMVSVIKGLSEITNVDVKDFVLEQTQSNASPDSRDQKVVEKGEGADARVQKSIRVQLSKLDELMYMFEELVIEKSRLEQLAKQIDQPDLLVTAEKMNRSISHLQSVMLSIRMMTLDTVFTRFPKMVRKIAKEVDKDIHFVVEGGETEIDKALIDELSDPLLHLLRNSIDHGIEHRDKRKALHKAEKGTITLRAFYKGSRVVIEIEDDGGGIDRERVLQKALSLDLLTEDDAANRTDEEVFQLLFQSGFSTADTVTDLSGRGVGLDVVKTNLEKIGGTIEVASRPGEGSTFSISLPLTVSIMEALLVRVNNDTFAIPVSAVLETATIKTEDIHYSQNQAMIDVRGLYTPVVSLRTFVGVEVDEQEEWSVVVIYQKNKLVALRVDDFVGHSEIVLKSLGSLLKGTTGLLGATILGDGKIAMVLDTSMYFQDEWRMKHE
ncbi:chemotaxis protein CheA [Shouchella sp. 1P09AA]|uniref:chemotaxis protein CheW n=1 Tax=unclassified Shouchella TaxID=2893065 RepID=UPI00399F1151